MESGKTLRGNLIGNRITFLGNGIFSVCWLLARKRTVENLLLKIERFKFIKYRA
jgi:hypothetical protein